MNTFEAGVAVGKTIKYSIIVGLVAAAVIACSGDSKWMSGKEFAANLPAGEKVNTPEAKALIAAFDKDNGKEYCVPKMSGEELGNFRTALPGMMIRNAFTAAFSGQIGEQFEKDLQKAPYETALRLALKQSYPCSK
jgi:hypothetical protein